MRSLHPLEVAALFAVAVPNLVFSLACIPPGCGSEERPDAPERVVVEAAAPGESDFGPPPPEEPPAPVETGSTGDTGAPEVPPEPVACDASAPSLELRYGDEPVPDELWFAYGGKVQSCSGESGAGVAIGVVAEGRLLPGAVDVAWTVRVRGEETSRFEGAATWDAACSLEGLETGHVTLGLPKDADGAEVTLDVTLTDAAGTQVSASSTFLAHVTQE